MHILAQVIARTSSQTNVNISDGEEACLNL